MAISYIVDDKQLDAKTFLCLVNAVWEGEYDEKKTQEALSKTVNVTAWADGKLVGCVRGMTAYTIEKNK